jgi:hypothetical protein
MSAIISTVTAQQWGLLNQPELQSFQKMYDEELLSEGIVFFPVALEHYYSKLGMSKTEFSFMRNLLQLWAKNDKQFWFAQEQIEELFGKSRRQVQRDARKLAKEGFIIISEWDDLNNGGTHCIHYDCTPFLQMISQLVRVHQHRNTLIDDISAGHRTDASATNNIVPMQERTMATSSSKSFAEQSIPTTPALPANISDVEASSVTTVTTVAIKGNHIHMVRGKKLSNARFADMYDPSYAEPDESEQPSRNNPLPRRQQASNQPISREPITEPRLAAQRDSGTQIAPATPYKMAQKTPIQASTQSDRERTRQENQQQAHLPLLSSVVMREVSQAFRDHAPQASQRDAAVIFRRFLLINRIQDDLTIKNPDQYFANLIKNAFQDLLAASRQQPAMHSGTDMMDTFMSDLNHAAFYQFEQIKILRHQRMQASNQYQRGSSAQISPQPRPIQLAEQESVPPFAQNSRGEAAATSRPRVQPRARNFPVGEELVALAHHMHISMTEEEANAIEIGTASEQLLSDIQDAILISYEQQPDIIAKVNYA